MPKQTLSISVSRLKRKMKAAHLSVAQITELMLDKGWGFYPHMLYRQFREKERVELDRAMMNDLLAILRETRL